MMSCHSVTLTLLAASLAFGYAYNMDTFQALEVHFRQPPYSFSTLQFNLMYFFMYLPIFLFNIPIGIIIDRFQITLSLLTLLSMGFISQLVLAVMTQTQVSGYIVVMLIMRSSLGLAGQGVFTISSMIITKYCKDNFEIAMSISLALPFVFDSLNSLVTTRVYDVTNSMTLPMYIGSGIALFSVFSGFIILKIYVCEESDKLQINEQQTEIEQQDQSFHLSQLKSLPYVFWIMIMAIFLTQIGLGSFLDNANDLLVKSFNIPYTDAGVLLMIPYSCLTIFSIIFSILISKHPSIRRILYLISSFLYVLGQVFLYLLPITDNPTVIYYIVVSFFLLTISFSYSIYFSAILAAISCVVEQKAVGTAYGVAGSVVGLSQILSPVINILIIDSNEDLAISYKRLNFMYIFIAIMPLLVSIYLKFGNFPMLDKRFQDNENEQTSKPQQK